MRRGVRHRGTVATPRRTRPHPHPREGRRRRVPPEAVPSGSGSRRPAARRQPQHDARALAWNDEVTNIFRFEGPRCVWRRAVPVALDYSPGSCPRTFPDVVVRPSEGAAGRALPRRATGTGPQDRQLLTETSAGPDLGRSHSSSRRTSRPPSSAGSVRPGLALGSWRLSARCARSSLVIGIDPESVEIDPVEAAKPEGVEWVNIASVLAIPQRRDRGVALPAREAVGLPATGRLLRHGQREPERCSVLRTPGARNAEAVVADRRMAQPSCSEWRHC